MKKTARTILAFDERQLEFVNKLKDTFAAGTGEPISNKEMFLIAMGVGFHSKNKLSDFKRSGNGVRIEYFQPEDNVLFAALQVAETGKSESLLATEELYNLAELYAGGGISILWSHFLQENDFAVWFASFVTGSLSAGKSE